MIKIVLHDEEDLEYLLNFLQLIYEGVEKYAN